MVSFGQLTDVAIACEEILFHLIDSVTSTALTESMWRDGESRGPLPLSHVGCTPTPPSVHSYSKLLLAAPTVQQVLAAVEIWLLCRKAPPIRESARHPKQGLAAWNLVHRAGSSAAYPVFESRTLPDLSIHPPIKTSNYSMISLTWPRGLCPCLL